MKKLIALVFSVVAIAICGCTTNVVVDSRAFPMASYDEISGSFTAKLSGSITSA